MLDIVSLVGFASLVAGVALQFGYGWALIVAGATLLTVVSAAVRTRNNRQ